MGCSCTTSRPTTGVWVQVPGPAPNILRAERNIRVVVLPCDEYPCGKAIGEPTMWKYLPYPLQDKKLLPLLNPYWKTRMIY